MLNKYREKPFGSQSKCPYMCLQLFTWSFRNKWRNADLSIQSIYEYLYEKNQGRNDNVQILWELRFKTFWKLFSFSQNILVISFKFHYLSIIEWIIFITKWAFEKHSLLNDHHLKTRDKFLQIFAFRKKKYWSKFHSFFFFVLSRF